MKKRKNRFHPVAVEEKDWPQRLKARLAWEGGAWQPPAAESALFPALAEKLKARLELIRRSWWVHPEEPIAPPPALPPSPAWLEQYGQVKRIAAFPGSRPHLPEGDSVFRTEAPGERQAILWRISGKDGGAVNKRTLPEKPDERSWQMQYIPSARVYLYEPTVFLSEEEQREQKRLLEEDEKAFLAYLKKQPYPIVALNDQFQEIQRFSLAHGHSLDPMLTVFSGQNAWLMNSCGRKDTYTRLKLLTGQADTIRLEAPACLRFAGTDGTLYARDWQGKTVFCFDGTGRLLSRHRVKGRIRLWMEDEILYFWDDQAIMEGPTDALPQVWRLES